MASFNLGDAALIGLFGGGALGFVLADDDFDFVARLPLYYDLITLALQTDSTRVITLEVSGIGDNSGGLPLRP